MNLLLMVLEDAFWSAIAATGFAMLFNVPRRVLIGCILAGATGHALRHLVIELFDMPVEVATLLAATCVGFLAVRFARHFETPSLIFGVCGAIPMVPGLTAYGAMLGLIRVTVGNETDTQVLMTALVDVIRVALILGAIALGIIMPKLIFSRVKPIV